jgi:hypothetical protein
MVALTTAARAEAPWEPVSNKNGITVDRRAVDGSKLKEFRGRGTIEAPLASILAVFSDVDHAVEWMDSCRASSVVEDGGDRDKVVYNRTRARWPVWDRDAVLGNHVYFDAAEGRVRLEFSTVTDDKMPPQKGVVRMPYLRGHWYLWPETATRTRVEYQVHANPGGALPEWLVNYVSRELPRKTITGLDAQVKRRQYPDLEKHIRAFPEYQLIERKLASN